MDPLRNEVFIRVVLANGTIQADDESHEQVAACVPLLGSVFVMQRVAFCEYASSNTCASLDFRGALLKGQCCTLVAVPFLKCMLRNTTKS